jgi:disulfide bond formation protein DsbB
MSVYGQVLVAGFGSALMLLAALGFQYLGGLAPCTFCVWQRWPHLAAVVLAGLAVTVLWRQRRVLAGLGGVAMLIGAGLAGYHVGVEQGWWQGLSTCTAPDPGAMSADQLLEQILQTPMVRCDEVAWRFVGLSMAAWNGILSIGLAALWVWSAATVERRA